MAFINEKIPEEDQVRINWEPYRVRRYARMPFKPFMWTIDRQRNVFLILIKTRGRDPGPDLFAFCWHGTLIRFPAIVQLNYESIEVIDISWECQFLIPDALIAHKTEIENDLKEAIEAHGHRFGAISKFRNIHISIR